MTTLTPNNPRSPEMLRRLISYNPETGELIRKATMKPVYKMRRDGQQYVIVAAGCRMSLLRAVVALQTGRWPDPHEYRLTGGPTDVRWCNFLRVKDGAFRRCNACGEMKHQSNFTPSGVGGRSFNSHCGPCGAARKRVYGRRHAWKKKYGVSQEDYDAQLVLQDGGCALCKKTPEENGQYLAVDHCHATGRNRELLCTTCNTGLGAFQDSPRLMLEAARYVMRHRE